MAGLVAPPPVTDPAGATVAADGWFPPVFLAAIRATVRLGEGVVTHDRLKAAIEGAILSALRDLEDWQQLHQANGIAALAGVTSAQVAGRNKAELIWERAVRYYAAAELADLHSDISATNEAIDRLEEKTLSADHYRRLAYAAIADLRSIGAPKQLRGRVELV